MTFEVSERHNALRLAATFADLSTGLGRASVLVYSGAKPAVGGVPVGGLLATIVLDAVPGAMVAGVLQLAITDVPAVVASGAAVWCRMLNGAGDLVGDGDVTDMAGAGVLRLATTTLIEGYTLDIVSAALG